MGWGFHHHARRHGGHPGQDCGPRGWKRGWHWGPFEVEIEAGFPGGGRGRRRMFDGDELKLILLKLIEEQPRHGYDLIREIEERSSGAYAPSPGVVYPTLAMLDEMDLIEERKSEGAKKQFGITISGSSHLTERTDQVEALFKRLAELGSMRERGSRGPIKRAMMNLRAALQDKLAEGDEDVQHRVAEIIDEAVQRIERL